MIPTNKGNFPEVIDSTIRAEFVECPTKGFYSFFRNLGPLEPSIDLIAGGAFAKGLEVTRLGFYYEKLPLPKALEKGMLAAIADYGTVEVPEFKETKGVDRVVTALAAYFEHFNPVVDHIQPYFAGDGKPAVEFTFSVPLPITHPVTGNPLLYAGRFDMLGLYNSQLMVVDEKTASQLGATWTKKWNLRGQFTGYVWACQQYGLPTVGAVARGVAFYKETKANPTGHGFVESLQMRPQWMLEAWYEQLLRDVERMKQSYLEGWFDQDFNEACANYSGCPFQLLCSSPDPENWIEGKFAKRVWNPLDKNPATQPEQKVEVVDVKEELKHLL